MTFAHWIAWGFALSIGIYLAISLGYLAGHRPGMTVAYVGYAIANAGFIYDAFNSVPK